MAEASSLSRAEDLSLAASRPPRGLWSDAFRRLRKNRLALAAGAVLVAFTALAVAANYVDAVQRHEPEVQNYDDVFEGPSTRHFFGTDNLGRDNWARVMQGALISIQIGLGVQVIVLIIGILVGGTAALTGRVGDNLLMRFTDLAYAFPDLLFIILLRAVLTGRDWPVLGNERIQMILAISFVAWVTVARLVRGQMLSLARQDYVLAARALGASPARVVFQHMLPNTLGPVIVAVTFGIPTAIFAEAVLGFIGFGLPPPTASLGRLVADGYIYMQTNVWIAVFPAATVALLMLSFTFLGDGLRDALDPRTR
ncbi:MAG TPA: ABC transporter permease [Dehalococcoidia bacterium]